MSVIRVIRVTRAIRVYWGNRHKIQSLMTRFSLRNWSGHTEGIVLDQEIFTNISGNSTRFEDPASVPSLGQRLFDFP